MGFDVAALFSRLILKPAGGGIEGVTNGDVDVFMSLIDRLGAVDYHVLTRYADIDPHAIELALMVQPMMRS